MNTVHLLPNLMTTLNFFCGMYSVMLSLRGDFPKAALWILVAMLFDFLDGQLARLSKSCTKFGEEYDSLADLTTFGIAPVILMYEMSLSGMGRFGISVAFIYAVSCALRLARYNAKLDGRPKSFFIGLPSPAAGGFIAASVLAADQLEWPGIARLAPFLLLLVSFLMISTVEYPSLRALGFRRKGPFLYLVAVVVSLGGFIVFGELCLSLGFLLYIFGGMAYHVVLKHRGGLVFEESDRLETEDL